MLSKRVARLEREKQFRDWLAFERFLESFTEQQLEIYATHGQLPQPLPEPQPEGASRFDGIDRKELMKMWEAHEREFGNRTKEELDFYCVHGHWPARCATSDAAKKKLQA